MQNHAENSLANDYAAALDWWRGAGVDCDFNDEPQSWLEDPEEVRKPAPPPSEVGKKAEETPHTPSITKDMLPADLAAFQSWWADKDTPLPGGSQTRVAPRGGVDASLMILAPMPEIDDRETLLSAAQGKLISNIAKAIGVDPASVYWASALPANMPLPDWAALKADGLGEAVKHHIALAKPQRLLIFGSKLPALLGHDADAPPEKFSELGGFPALTTFAPERLLDHPRQRARLWHRLLQWTA
ncbi:hypothetical protein [Aurantiacibacter sp. D1-12]|uniref:hypothetical protein n=1 Tax=Aurantiacibacter sp. D1-12 TaxID=2993658 RepID=UPI00237CC11B|nr:hypothetical protein [Aurantiacibacter sp. D1-12]MDE1466563.1 hypothetical protein [Aurantiacibacter sp. D1-12]